MTDQVRTVAAAVREVLVRAGVRRGYGVPGESFLELLDELEAEPGFTLVSARHEGGASFMAEADGKLHGRPALAMASRGPGATNLSIGIHTAHQDETPMIVLLGQVPTGKRDRESFQLIDLVAMFTPMTAWAVEAHAGAELPGLVAEGLARATGERPGPVVISVPSDLWAQPFEGPLPEPAARPRPQLPDLAALARALDDADAPVVIAGSRDETDRAELVATADALGLGVHTAFRSLDAFPEDHPNHLGHLDFGMTADQLKALESADLVLLLGSRDEEVSTQGFRFPLPGQELVRVRSRIAEVLADLRGRATPRDRDWSVATAADARARRVGPVVPEGTVDPVEVVRTLRGLVPADTIVTVDAGNFARPLHRNWRFTLPRTYLGPRNGAMGYGVPAAVAAALSTPDRLVVAVCGDGGALMTGQEIETAVRLGLPVLVLVFRNGLYGTIAMHQAQHGLPRTAVSIGEVDVAGWARALGATGFTLDSPDLIGPVLRAAVACDGPRVVDVRIADTVESSDAVDDFTEAP